MNDDLASIDKAKLAYNLEEAAEATGYSTSTLRIAIRRNDLIARYANTKPVILAEELLDWLRSLPTEPKVGHQPLSQLGNASVDWPGPPTASPRANEAANTMFRKPKEVARELGMSESTLRAYCRTSGIHTRLGKRIMLHPDDVERLVAWIRERSDDADPWSNEPEKDPFA